MFTEERIGEIVRQLKELRYPDIETQKEWLMRKTDGETKPVPSCLSGDWQPVAEGVIWGGHMEYWSFRGTVTIPERFAGKIVEFRLLTGREGEWDATNPQFTAYVDGSLRHGLDVNHRTVRLTDCAEAGKSYEIFLSAFTGNQNFHLYFDAALQTVDTKVIELYYDLSVPWQTACMLEQDSRNYLDMMPVLERAVNALDLRKPGSEAFYRSVEVSDNILKEAFYTVEREADSTAACVGHTHIDVAWLWTLAVTQDKSVRSFSTVLELMKRYPEYIFMSSQPQLYKYVKQNAPEIFEEIKKRVAEGRWEAEGGMWLEPDCNLASGEAMVRQFLHGKRFFREEFGVDNKIMWLPDVFGYSAALPQIMKKSGVDYFMTTKISWNDTNKMPYDTFYWKGIDGTSVLTHFVPTRDYEAPGRTHPTCKEHYSAFCTAYNGAVDPSQLKGAWQRYQQKYLNSDVMVSYGFGDGGGGPTEEMLEVQRRLHYGIPGCPKSRQSTALDFFRKLERDVQGKKVPVWTGELYLEYHRGTYTTMARNKKYNRRSEFALSDLEADSLIAEKLCGTPYPKKELYENWEVLLRNQFHDILPGSAIREVYEDSKEEYEKLLAFAAEEEEIRQRKIADGVGKTVVFNHNGQSMSGLVTVRDAGGMTVVQPLADGASLVWAQDIPAKGYAVLKDTAPAAGMLRVSRDCIETDFAKITLNAAGQISSWYDKKAGRELLQKGRPGNVLTAYEDKPHEFDNWNIYDYYREKSWTVDELLGAEVTEQGPLRGALKLKWRYQDSVIEETVYAYSFSPRVDFRFSTDWKEDQILLKALFPVELNTSEATYEIQYGNVKRSTAVNTSWDAARFEVCYHKWMDLSEGGYGVSFLNDCKFGVGVYENEVGLSLLRCGTYPNPAADREYHEAVYSVLPHEGSWTDAGTVKEAYLLNNPLQPAEPSANAVSAGLPERYSLAQADSKNIMIEAAKQAEDSSAAILRLYDFENKRTETTVRLMRPAKQIWLCDMMERKQQLLAENTETFRVQIKPYEIVSLMIEE